MRGMTSPPYDGRFELNRESQQARGLVAWWPPLGNHDGKTLRNWLGSGNATINGTVGRTVDSTFGRVLNLPGGSGNDITGTLALNKDLHWFTWSAWYKQIASVSYQMYFVVAGAGNTNNQMRASAVTLVNDSGTTVPSGYTLTNGIWTHLVLTAQSKGARQGFVWYINGAQVYAEDSWAIYFRANGAYRIGSRSDCCVCNGQMTDIRIYDRALTANEVYALWNPATRWDLYGQPRRIWYVPAAAAVYANRLLFAEQQRVMTE